MPSRRDVLAAASTAVLGSTAGCLSSPDPSYAGYDAPDTKWWPRPTFDQYGTCYNPNAVGPTSVSERWHTEISTPSARPVVADGTAFLPAADAVLAVGTETGETKWREPGDDGPFWPRQVTCHDGTVYVASVDETGLYAIDANSGERLWTFSPSDPEFGVHTIHLDDDGTRLFAGTHGAVYEFDPTTGERRWRQEVFGVVTHLALSPPHLLVGTEGGEIYALSPDDGNGYWRRNLVGPKLTALAGSNNGRIYASFFDGPTFGLNSSGGVTEWKKDVWTSDSFVVTRDALVTAGNKLAVRGSGDGESRWTGGSTTQCGPAATGDTVYAASEGQVAAYKIGGGTGVEGLRIDAKRWSYDVAGPPEQGIAVADGAVFVLTEGGGEDESSMAYALEAE